MPTPLLDVLILRDLRESVRKCSLTPLRGLPGIEFRAYDPDLRLPADGRVLLHPDGEELGAADRGAGLLLLDCAWRRVPSLLRTVDGPYTLRRLPALATAYPRRSKHFHDPERGLASVEALYAAVCLLRGPVPELLERYPFAAAFLAANPDFAPRAAEPSSS